jgi:hypothetical protein
MMDARQALTKLLEISRENRKKMIALAAEIYASPQDQEKIRELCLLIDPDLAQRRRRKQVKRTDS